ncbi:hypothetical protein [Streptomyces massasporeus]|uniref:hypothetical protein n=1 Tax=Streptomyces massasporeus TaxID=67324 RepID=UPI00369353D9
MSGNRNSPRGRCNGCRGERSPPAIGSPGERPGEHAPARTPQLREKVADNPEFDVLLCAQNVPASIDIGPATTARSARVGWATVSTYWNGGSDKADFTAYVDLDATRPIQLLDVDCGSEG